MIIIYRDECATNYYYYASSLFETIVPFYYRKSVRAKIPTGRVADSPPAGSERDGVLRYVRKSAGRLHAGKLDSNKKSKGTR